MDTELRLPLTQLTSGSTLRVQDGEGGAVLVFEGRVWITQDDDLRDIVLDAGESFRLDRDGLALVTALADTQVMLLQAEHPTRAAWSGPSSFELARQARVQRSAVIGDAIGHGVAWLLATIRAMLARLVPHALGSGHGRLPRARVASTCGA